VSGVHAIPCCERADGCAPPNAAPSGYNVEGTPLRPAGGLLWIIPEQRVNQKLSPDQIHNYEVEKVRFAEIVVDLLQARFWIVSALLKITGPNLFAPYFSVSALIIKQFGRLFSA